MNIKSKHGFIAVLTAVILAILTIITTYNFNAHADNSSLKYVRYNAKTGAYLGSYTLSSMPEDDNSRTVFPPDERVIDWTKSGVVKLIIGNAAIGSGFVVGEHTIATAGHCVKNAKITKIILFNSDGTVAKYATPVESHFPKIYNDSHIGEKEDVDFDYGLITVKEDLSDFMCFYLAAPMDDLASRNCAVSVTGFPLDYDYGKYNDFTTHNMYTGNGVITATEDKTLLYNVDTSGGNSGGPVYVTESYNGQVYYSVIAVHTHGGNTGTRMTFDLLHFYLNNNYQNY